MKGCGCRRCRSGMHTKQGGKLLQKFIRRARRKAKLAIERGVEPARAISIGYTD